jgi:hypothetical protein
VVYTRQDIFAYLPEYFSLDRYIRIEYFKGVTKKETKKKAELQPFSIKLPTDLLAKVREKSAETGISMTFIIRRALEDWIKTK